MDKSREKVLSRKRKQARVRKQIRGTNECPRLTVFRSLRYIYAQIISDETGSVLACADSKSLCSEGVSACSKAGAKLVGQKIAELAKEKNVEKVVFDRNGYLYHGRIAAVAEGAREAGMKF